MAYVCCIPPQLCKRSACVYPFPLLLLGPSGGIHCCLLHPLLLLGISRGKMPIPGGGQGCCEPTHLCCTHCNLLHLLHVLLLLGVSQHLLVRHVPWTQWLVVAWLRLLTHLPWTHCLHLLIHLCEWTHGTWWCLLGCIHPIHPLLWG